VIGPARLMTSLDMKGLSISALPLGDDLSLREMLCSEGRSAGVAAGTRRDPRRPPAAARRHAGRRPRALDPRGDRALAAICATLASLEAELDALDAKIGDGDTGTTFATAARTLLAELDACRSTNPPRCAPRSRIASPR
jgi:dihydroxyacetone kinase